MSRISPETEVLKQAHAALLRIRTASIAGCLEGYGKPEQWADELFASHGDVTKAMKAIDGILSSVHAQTPADIIEKASEMLRRRAAGYDARHTAIFSGRIMAEELKANAREIEALADTSTDRPAGLIHPDVLMNVVQAKLNDYIELQSRGDLTECGDHAWLVLVNLQRDMEFALSQSSPDRSSK